MLTFKAESSTSKITLRQAFVGGRDNSILMLFPDIAGRHPYSKFPILGIDKKSLPTGCPITIKDSYPSLVHRPRSRASVKKIELPR